MTIMETKKNEISEKLKRMSKEEKAAMLEQLQNEVKTERQEKRGAYEDLRKEFLKAVEGRVDKLSEEVVGFKHWLEEETEAFVDVMRDYGAVKTMDQRNFTITNSEFKLQVSSNKVKGFDERADMAAERLMDYLKRYMAKSAKGEEDAMYQLAMTLLERNQAGDLDYKSISKLYEFEQKFNDAEYSEIMELFKESNVVQKTALNFYFWRRDETTGVWYRIEPSFCRL